MSYRHLLVENDGGVRRLTLDRPERLNALNIRIGIELLDALEEIDRDAAVRAVILTGAGRAFCAGDDLKGMADADTPYRPLPDPIAQYTHGEGRWPLVIDRMRRLGTPVIAMINGHAHGAGFNLALGCDLRIMADDATLAVPFVKRGLATGTSLLQQFVGIGKAMEWALLAPTLSAAEAERWGLVNTVTPSAELETTTLDLARRLADGPTRVIGITKRAIVAGWQETDPMIAYEHQGLALEQARGTNDFTEGRTAFIDKRDPRFTGT